MFEIGFLVLLSLGTLTDPRWFAVVQLALAGSAWLFYQVWYLLNDIAHDVSMAARIIKSTIWGESSPVDSDVVLSEKHCDHPRYGAMTALRIYQLDPSDYAVKRVRGGTGPNHLTDDEFDSILAELESARLLRIKASDVWQQQQEVQELKTRMQEATANLDDRKRHQERRNKIERERIEYLRADAEEYRRHMEDKVMRYHKKAQALQDDKAAFDRTRQAFEEKVSTVNVMETLSSLIEAVRTEKLPPGSLEDMKQDLPSLKTLTSKLLAAVSGDSAGQESYSTAVLAAEAHASPTKVVTTAARGFALHAEQVIQDATEAEWTSILPTFQAASTDASKCNFPDLLDTDNVELPPFDQGPQRPVPVAVNQEFRDVIDHDTLGAVAPWAVEMTQANDPPAAQDAAQGPVARTPKPDVSMRIAVDEPQIVAGCTPRITGSQAGPTAMPICAKVYRYRPYTEKQCDKLAAKESTPSGRYQSALASTRNRSRKEGCTMRQSAGLVILSLSGLQRVLGQSVRSVMRTKPRSRTREVAVNGSSGQGTSRPLDAKMNEEAPHVPHGAEVSRRASQHGTGDLAPPNHQTKQNMPELGTGQGWQNTGTRVRETSLAGARMAEAWDSDTKMGVMATYNGPTSGESGVGTAQRFTMAQKGKWRAETERERCTRSRMATASTADSQDAPQTQGTSRGSENESVHHQVTDESLREHDQIPLLSQHVELGPSMTRSRKAHIYIHGVSATNTDDSPVASNFEPMSSETFLMVRPGAIPLGSTSASHMEGSTPTNRDANEATPLFDHSAGNSPSLLSTPQNTPGTIITPPAHIPAEVEAPEAHSTLSSEFLDGSEHSFSSQVSKPRRAPVPRANSAAHETIFQFCDAVAQMPNLVRPMTPPKAFQFGCARTHPPSASKAGEANLLATGITPASGGVFDFGAASARAKAIEDEKGRARRRALYPYLSEAEFERQEQEDEEEEEDLSYMNQPMTADVAALLLKPARA